MAVKIEGRQVKWGITAGIKTASDALIAGIVQSASIEPGGNMEEITDEDGDIVTRVDHGKSDILNLTILVTAASPSLPEKGDEVTGLGTYNGIDFSAGRAFIESASWGEGGVQAAQVTLQIKHYPEMAADA